MSRLPGAYHSALSISRWRGASGRALGPLGWSTMSRRSTLELWCFQVRCSSVQQILILTLNFLRYELTTVLPLLRVLPFLVGRDSELPFFSVCIYKRPTKDSTTQPIGKHPWKKKLNKTHCVFFHSSCTHTQHNHCQQSCFPIKLHISQF